MTKFYDKDQLKKFENGNELKMKKKEKYLDLPNDFYINKKGEMVSEITLKQLNSILDYIEDLQFKISDIIEYLTDETKELMEDTYYKVCNLSITDDILNILRGDE